MAEEKAHERKCLDGTGANRGLRPARLLLRRKNGNATLELTIDNVTAKAQTPLDIEGALAVLRPLQAALGVPGDVTFTRTAGDLLVKAAKLFEESMATKFELSSMRLRPTPNQIDGAALVADKPLHLKTRLKPLSLDRNAAG
jgi:hypothetical protein